MITFICTGCKIEQPLSQFSKKASSKRGHSSRCKVCCSNDNKKWRRENPEINKDCQKRNYEKRQANPEIREKEIQRKKQYILNNPEKHAQSQHNWYLKNKGEHRAYGKNYYNNNKERIRDKARIREQERRKEDLVFKIKKALRSRLRSALRSKSKKGSAVKDLGCSIEEVIQYLESKFFPGMSWENWAPHGWHIDHIIPLSRFDLTKPDEVKKACHYTNLQPLWAFENLSKGAKLK